MPSPKTRRRVQESPPLSAAGSSITQRQRPTTTESSSFLHRYIVPLYSHLALESRYDALYILLLLSFEALFGILILQNVAYTEIDWVAYMQQVTLFHQQGERDYLQIRGDTGPLVYPAGFLYLFGVLYEWTQQGTNVRQAQVYFLGFYLMTQWLVMMLFLKRIQNMRQQLQVTKDWNTKSQTIHSIWLWRVAMGMLCLSKRLHSIYLLRLFNDGPTMMLLYASILLFQCQQWKLGCVLFSLAVSVKMNVLLFAPGLLLLLLQALPDLGSVVQMLLLYCALPQLVLGAPFLSTFPVSYLRKAFELDRVFFYKWTVNWKFLSEDVFVSKPLSLLLLALHLSGLVVCAVAWLRTAKQQFGQRLFLSKHDKSFCLSPHYIAYTLFVSNFIGIVFARTLHYQFYSWYFHSIPYLLWTWIISSRGPDQILLMRLALSLAVIVGIEVAFLTYPATPVSSAILQACHLLVLATIRPPKSTHERNKKVKKKKKNS